MRINASDLRYETMSDNRRELIAMIHGLQASQAFIASLMGVKAGNVNLWVRPERQGTVEPPYYTVNLMRAYLLLSEDSRARLKAEAPVIDIALVMMELDNDPKTSLIEVNLLSAAGQELVSMMAVCRVNQRSLSRLLGIHHVTINRWLRPQRDDAKVAPFHAINFLRAFYLLPEDKRLKLNSAAPLIDVDAALRGEGITFVR